MEQAEKHNALVVATGGDVHQISGVARDGLTDVLRAIRAAIISRDESEVETEDTGWRP